MQRTSALASLILAALVVSPAPARGGVPSSAALGSLGYQKVLERRGVTVYRKPQRGIINVAAEGRFAAPPEKVRQALLAYERHPGRISRLKESRVLRRGDSSLLVYQRLDLPVISDRDFTLHVRWGHEGDVLWTQFRAVDEHGPASRRGVVRLKHHQGSWILRPTADGRGTLARYRVSMDLGGWVPGWMARSGTSKEMPNLFAAIAGLIPR